VRDFEAVPLHCDQLDKSVVKEIERLTDGFNQGRSPSNFKRAMVKNVPRRAVVKPEHSIYRLQNQKFDLGDRVVMVQESGGVPLAAKGVVIGLNTKSIDVVWDVPFISGTTLSSRCSQYRGSTVEFNVCLNLTNRQFVSSVNASAQPPPFSTANAQPNSRFGSQARNSGPGGHRPQSGARGGRPHAGFGSDSRPVHIMINPNHGRGGAHVNGRASSSSQPNGTTRRPAPASSTDDQESDGPRGYHQEYRRPPVPPRGGFMRGRDFGNRGHRGGFRGRGGYNAAPPLSS